MTAVVQQNRKATRGGQVVKHNKGCYQHLCGEVKLHRPSQQSSVEGSEGGERDGGDWKGGMRKERDGGLEGRNERGEEREMEDGREE